MLNFKLKALSVWEKTIFGKNLIKSEKGNKYYKMKDKLMWSCQKMYVIIFYKCANFQVESFDSVWENSV